MWTSQRRTAGPAAALRAMVAALSGLAAIQAALAGTTTRVSVASGGTQANGPSDTQYRVAISADGRYVAFTSEATNLVPGDTNDMPDVFVHDRQTGQTERASVASDGSQGDGASSNPSISADGRYVAFTSHSNNFVANDADRYDFHNTDIFVRDRQTGQTTRVSTAVDGYGADGNSWAAAISGDGRFVAFTSWASDLMLVPDLNYLTDVYVCDRQTGQMGRVSVRADGNLGDDNSDRPSISADGRFVAFESYASNLVAGDTNSQPDVFVHDRQTGQPTRVSVASDGTQGNSGSMAPSISADGRYVAFSSGAMNLVPGETNVFDDIFVRDRLDAQTTRVSVASDGTQANSSSEHPAISPDGRYVAFDSGADNLILDDANTWNSDIFVHDRQTGQTTLASVASSGTQANSWSYQPAISSGGAVAFKSWATNLVAGDTNGQPDVFVHDPSTSPPVFPPDPPSGVAASDGTYSDKVRITWNAATGATAYEVWRHTSNVAASATRIAASVTATTCDDTTAAFGTTYYYWVKAKNTAGTSGVSASDSGYRALPLVVCVDDSNATGTENGTAQNPFNTIQEGIAAVADGGTVKVAAGIYVGNVRIPDKWIAVKGGYVGRTSYPGTGDFAESSRDTNPATNGTVVRGDVPLLIDVLGAMGRNSLFESFRVRGEPRFHLIFVRCTICEP